MIYTPNFRKYVVRPVLKHLDMYSESAENLIVGTALVESGLVHLKQLFGGPALGVMQMEPATHDWLWDDYLKRKPRIRSKIRGLTAAWNFFENRPYEMVGNLNYAVAMCRLRYWVIPKSLPDKDDLMGIASYWKVYYNTVHGKGTVKKFIKAYNRQDTE